MDALFLDALHRYVFVLLAVVGACWLAARVLMLLRDAAMWLLECFADQDSDETTF